MEKISDTIHKRRAFSSKATNQLDNKVFWDQKNHRLLELGGEESPGRNEKTGIRDQQQEGLQVKD